MTYMPLQLPPGIVRGANPDDTPGRWYDGSLVRWREGIMEPVGGWSRVTLTPLGSTPRAIQQWRRNNNLKMTLIGCDSHLYTDDSGTYVDVAPADLVGLNTSPGCWLRHDHIRHLRLRHAEERTHKVDPVP